MALRGKAEKSREDSPLSLGDSPIPPQDTKLSRCGAFNVDPSEARYFGSVVFHTLYTDALYDSD